MKVPSPTEGRTRISHQGSDYFRAAEIDTRPITAGLNAAANAASTWAERNRVENEQTKRFKALDDYTNWQIKVDETLSQAKQTVKPDTANFPLTWETMYQNMEDEFIAGLPGDQQEEFRVRTGSDRRRTINDAQDFSIVQRRGYSNAMIDDQYKKQSNALNQSPDTLAGRESFMHDYIDRAPGLSAVEKFEKKRTASQDLQGITYRHEVKNGDTARLRTPKDADDLTPKAQTIKFAADELGIDPTVLATVISYETGGTFSPGTRGGKDNKYIGLIQFGEEEQAKYGANQKQSFEEQMGAVVRYLKDRGLKPGMGLKDVYSTINAGKPGLYSRSDRPGYTVNRHVEEMAVSGHAKVAEELMGGRLDLDGIDNDPQFAAVPLEDRIALRKQAESERNAEIAEQLRQNKEAHAQYTNDLYIGLSEGKYGQREIDQGVDAGLLDDYNDRQKAKDILKKKEDDNSFAREGSEKIGEMGRGGSASFIPTDADDNKRLNAVIGKDGVNKINAQDDNYVNNYLIPTIRTAHVIPSDVSGTLTALMRSYDPKKALWAMDALARIQDQDPAAFDQRMDEKTSRDVDFWRTKKEYYTQDELLSQINGGRTQEERSNKIALREEAEKLIKDGKVDPHDFINSFDGYFSREPGLGNVPWAAAEMGKDYNAVFAEEYTRYGNKDEAHAATVKAMSRVWGVTEIGGTKTLMKYPPEKAGYDPVNNSMDWIDRQVRSDLNIPPDFKFQLLETPNKTEQEFAAWKRDPANNHPPGYNVAVQGPDGTWRTPLGPDGLPARVYFQVTDEEKAAETGNFELNKAMVDYTEFMQETYLKQMAFNLGPDGRAEIDAKRKALEERIKTARIQAGIDPTTPMLPHPNYNPGNRARFKAFEPERDFIRAPSIEELGNGGN